MESIKKKTGRGAESDCLSSTKLCQARRLLDALPHRALINYPPVVQLHSHCHPCLSFLFPVMMSAFSLFKKRLEAQITSIRWGFKVLSRLAVLKTMIPQDDETGRVFAVGCFLCESFDGIKRSNLDLADLVLSIKTWACLQYERAPEWKLRDRILSPGFSQHARPRIWREADFSGKSAGMM